MGATLFFAGRFFCALMMTLAVSVSYDHREQEQTIFRGMFPFRYHRIEHIEEQYDGPSMIFLLAGVQPGSFVMRMVDNSESHFLFPGTLLISCITVVVFHTRIFFASSTLLLPHQREFLAIFYIYPSYLRMPARHPSTAHSEWYTRPPSLHRIFRVV
ncbi:hypothetical protein T12_15102 [Trichinella patagoniensis]|uniref:Uncharacterized protein n=1 Tax=Trichinella patagoniensis TaxID=990121 RepID=A0A0V0ZGJ1_9BILA|nr:hypothetical protein T12_15102 [Trichinella patagoniensis]